MPSSLLQVVNSLFQTCHNKLGTSSANTTCWQFVNRFVTTCLQTCYKLFVFTCVRKNLTTCQQDVFALIVVDKSGTSCYHLVTRLMRPTDSQQVVPTSLISSARNKLLTSWWQQARSNLLRTACISLVGTTCSKSVTVINLVTRW
jgi:hypothetical protein